MNPFTAVEIPFSIASPSIPFLPGHSGGHIRAGEAARAETEAAAPEAKSFLFDDQQSPRKSECRPDRLPRFPTSPAGRERPAHRSAASDRETSN